MSNELLSKKRKDMEAISIRRSIKEGARASVFEAIKNHPNASDTSIAAMIGKSRQFVTKWKNRTSFKETRQRMGKITPIIRKFIFRKAANKLTASEGASINDIWIETNLKFGNSKFFRKQEEKLNSEKVALREL